MLASYPITRIQSEQLHSVRNAILLMIPRLTYKDALRVYRFPNLLAYLNLGKLVHAVPPKSLCWCVDGKSKFVLGKADKSYYRIELPFESEEDQAKANDFKAVLTNISQYETTPCPFKRGFHVELPETKSLTPKRPWTPKRAPGVTSPWSPEGQHLSDGARIERLFPSPKRQTSQSPRQSYKYSPESVERSYMEYASDVSQETATMLDEAKVPRLVATFDKFGPCLDRYPAAAPFDILQNISPDDANTTDPVSQQESYGDRDESSRNQLESSFNLMGLSSGPVTKNPDNLTVGDDDNGWTIELPKYSRSQSSSSEASNPSHLHTKHITENLNWLSDEGDGEIPIASRPYHKVRSVTATITTPLQSDTNGSDHTKQTQRPRHDSEAESLVSVESSSSFRSFHDPTSPPLHSPFTETGTQYSPSSTSSKVHKRGCSSNTMNTDVTDSLPTTLLTPPLPIFSPPSDQDDVDDDTEASIESDTKSFTTAASPPSTERLSRPKIPLRIHSPRRRKHSPLPSPANIYTPPGSLSGHLSNIIFNRETASLLLGPPVHLVALMLNLARRFANGNLRCETYTYGDKGQPIPCEWWDSDENSSEEEDDYGISIGGIPEGVDRKDDVTRRRRSRSSRDDSRALD